MRRPFTSTSVEFTPRPRSEIAAEPDAKPAVKEDGSDPCPSAVMVRRISWIDCLPVRSISWRVMTWTGDAVSVSVRLMFEPVDCDPLQFLSALSNSYRTSAEQNAAESHHQSCTKLGLSHCASFPIIGAVSKLEQSIGQRVRLKP